MAAAPSNENQGKHWPKMEDWEKHRSLIECLYRELPLTKVMKTIENGHGFKATCVQPVNIRLEDFPAHLLAEQKCTKIASHSGVLTKSTKRTR